MSILTVWSVNHLTEIVSLYYDDARRGLHHFFAFYDVLVAVMAGKSGCVAILRASRSCIRLCSLYCSL